MKWCHSIADIPKEPHYAILESSTISIPGDERSRTHPGHGYPASTEQVWNYIVFETQEEWEKQIKSLESKAAEYGYKTAYVAISATPAKISSTVTIQIETPK